MLTAQQLSRYCWFINRKGRVMSVINRKMIRELRVSLRYSQQELANATGVPRGTIAAIEVGTSKRPSFPVVTAIAGVLQVRPESLFLPGDVAIPTNKPTSAK
jgi:DNA-binding XRE family transcriptional regulator